MKDNTIQKLDSIDEIIGQLVFDVHKSGSNGETIDKVMFRSLEAKQALSTLVAGIIGEDIPIFIDGKQMQKGDAMTIDLSGGIGDEKFRESCKNIEKNGRNLEKADVRLRAKEAGIGL